MERKKIIWVNGCFDIIHPGHIELLKYARSKGDLLIVGIDSDERVSILKGSNRPINNQYSRKVILESIRYVDEVVVFSSEIEMCDKLVEKNVDLIVIGDEYIGKNITGSNLCKVEFFNKIPNLSTSSIINKINPTDDI
jgi:D-beta-D-heptose 7-phosphate kinase/D-beta-D-heptose 1-phosphate adenosyltransferase